jgi:very-short-patch-repair endonuclease
MTEERRHPMTHAARALRRRSTDSERQLWELLRDRRFRGLKFRRQQPIGGRFVVDFYCAALQLAIEVDGPIHREQVVRDADRQRALEAEGITVVRLTVEQLAGDIAALLEELIPPDRSETPLRKGGEGQG